MCGKLIPAQQSHETITHKECIPGYVEVGFGTEFSESSVRTMIAAGRFVLSEGQAEAFDTDEEYRLRMLKRLKRLGFKGTIHAPNNLVGRWHGQEMS